MVHAVDFKLEPIELLLQQRASLIRLRARHLQGDESLLGSLLRLDHPTLQAAAAPLDAVPQARLHLLKLVEMLQDETQRSIRRALICFRSPSVVLRIGLHQSLILIPDC
jgi:hypothetical protein